jgi:nucleoside-diphosphate-sugar epimerase
MKRVFITGANGFLGLNLVEQFVAAGWQIVGLCEPASERRHIQRFGIEVVEGNILDLGSLRAAMPSEVDAVVHTAASTSIWSRNNELQTRINVLGTRNVCRACLDKGAKRLVHTSTWNTYGLEHKEITEATPQVGGKSWINYVRTKFLAEEEVRGAIGQGLNAIILNPSHIVGRYDTRNWARMFRMVDEGTLPGIPRTKGSFCHAEAVAMVHLAATEKGKTGENYLLPGVEATFAQVITLIAELLGKKAPEREIPMPLLKVSAHIRAAVAGLTGRAPDLTPEGVALMMNEPHIASTKAARELGYTVVPLRAMFEDSYNWLKAEGLVSSNPIDQPRAQPTAKSVDVSRPIRQ